MDNEPRWCTKYTNPILPTSTATVTWTFGPATRRTLRTEGRIAPTPEANRNEDEEKCKYHGAQQIVLSEKCCFQRNSGISERVTRF